MQLSIVELVAYVVNSYLLYDKPEQCPISNSSNDYDYDVN